MGRRALDVAGASMLLVLSGPVLLACALLILLADGPPILFRQERVGFAGRRFRIVKFRTMRPAAGPLVTRAGDPRVTRIGRWLRRGKLDELPQLWNVLSGTMTLVGPRPEVPAYVTAHPRLFTGIADLKPGITDWASLAFRDEEQLLSAHAGEAEFYDTVLLPRKVALARLYRRVRSPLLDLRLLAATALLAFGAERSMRNVAGAALLSRARRGVEALRPGD